MKRKRLLAGALACCLCLGVVVTPAKAVNASDGMLDAELYAQYYRAINRYEAMRHTIYYIDSELITPSRYKRAKTPPTRSRTWAHRALKSPICPSR